MARPEYGRGSPVGGVGAVREILKMGDPRLLRIAQPVRRFDTPELHTLIADMFETMAAANGAGLAAPQIGVDLQLVIFGYTSNARYPDAPPVPITVLINPVVTPLDGELVDGWEGCLSVPGLRGVVPRHSRIRYTGFDPQGRAIERKVEGFSKSALKALTAYDWPGNIRQLRNAVERMVVVDLDGLLDVDDLPDDIPPLHADRNDSTAAVTASSPGRLRACW